MKLEKLNFIYYNSIRIVTRIEDIAYKLLNLMRFFKTFFFVKK